MKGSTDTAEREGSLEALLAAAIEAAPDGIAVIRSGKLVFANTVFARWLGPGDQHTDQLDRLQALLEAARLGSGPFAEGQGSLPTQDGPLPLQVCLVSLEPAHSGARAVFARALGEPQRNERQLAAAERLKCLGQLAAGVAHDINNPLAFVLGSIEVAERGLRQGTAGRASLSDDVVLEAMANAREGAERVCAIVKDLLSFSKPVAESKELVDVEQVLDATVNLAWNQIRHRARLVKHYARVPFVLANESRLTQVFLNLLVNAAQAIEEGDPEAKITLRTLLEDGRVVVEVSDTGGGIGEHDLARVFEPFFTTKPAGLATGLGLAIVQSIITSYGGGIDVSTRKGAGATFRVWLPSASSTPSGEPIQAVFQPAVTRGPARILIVDDEPLLGHTLSLAFSGRHDVVLASSGREALRKLAEDSNYDLVLCDLMMPDVPGQKVFEAVQRDHTHLVPRFVFMTGGAFTERAHEFLERYPGRRLDKPFTISDIEALLTA